MKKTITLATILLMYGSYMAQAPAIEWQKCLGGSYSDEAYSITQTQDGGYIVAGSTMSNDGDVSGNNGFTDAWVVKLDALGNITWQKCLGGSNTDIAHSIQQTQDGGYIVAGYSASNNGDVSGNHGNFDYWVVKLDALGNITWQKSLGGSFSEITWSITQTQDGGYIVAGFSGSNDGDVIGNHGNQDYWVIKLDAFGNITWQKGLGGSGDEDCHSITQTQDGGYIVVGFTQSNDGDVTGNHGIGDYWIVKLDSLGNITWQKCLGGSSWDIATSISQTQDGGYIVAGYAGSNDGDVSGNHGFYDYWIVKLDALGNITWQKSLGGSHNDYAKSIAQTQDGGYIVAGFTYSNNGDVSGNHGFGDSWIIKLDALGNIIWQKSLGGSGADDALSISQTQEGGYIVAARSGSNDGDVTGNHGSFDSWIVKLGPDSTVITREKQNIVGITSLTLYPNPASETLTLELEGSGTEGASAFQIFDLQGKVVLNGVLNQGKNLVDISALAKGSYVVRTGSTGTVTERSRSMSFEVVE